MFRSNPSVAVVSPSAIQFTLFDMKTPTPRDATRRDETV